MDGEQLETVGGRKKGFIDSLSTEKPGLKVRFDKYVPEQSYGGPVLRDRGPTPANDVNSSRHRRPLGRSGDERDL